MTSLAHQAKIDRFLAGATKVYKGVRPPIGPRVVIEDTQGSYFLPVPQHITNFDWGRSGTSPAYLASALIEDALPWLSQEDRRWYTHIFLVDVVFGMTMTWRLEQREIVLWWLAESRR